MVTRAVRRTGFVCDDSYFEHRTEEGLGPWVDPGAAFETVAGKRRIRDLVVRSGLMAELVPVAAAPMSRGDVLRFHTEGYVDRLAAMSAAEGGDAGEATWFGTGSYEIALLSAGGTYAAVRAVVDEELDNAYALVRPPGHHAERDRGRGYCMLANLALAVMKARAELGVGRVAVIDWDVHHGNGTEQAFYDDPDVLTISIHQDRLYPLDSGFITHTGCGRGVGATINVPLPGGAGRGAYFDAWSRVVEPAVRRFRPDLVVVASGFDAGGLDPLGRMMLSAAAFGELTSRVVALADEVCGGRLVLTHEGGYSELHAPFCGLRVMETLSGASTGIEDPFGYIDAYGAQELAPHQVAVVDAVVVQHGLD
jgi:acetoin utilization deacetylase AcuC-like enzyme